MNQRDLKKRVRSVVMPCIHAAGSQPKLLSEADFEAKFIKEFPDKTSYEFDRLTFSQYQQVLLKQCWSTYADSFGLPVERVRALLDSTRELRNRLAHYRGLPSPSERAQLIYCRELLGRVADKHQDSPEDRPEVAPAPALVQAAPPQPLVLGVVAERVAARKNEDEDEDDDADEAGGDGSGLTTWLRSIEARERVTVDFSAVAKLLDGRLPEEALQHRSWWTNDEGASQSRHWRAASWRVVSANLSSQQVTFGRNTAEQDACIAAFGVFFRHLSERELWPHSLPSPAGRTNQALHNMSRSGGDALIKLAFARGERFRISLYIDVGEQAENKAIFDGIIQHRDTIEREIGAPLTWDRNPHRRASRIGLFYPHSVSIRSNGEALEALAEWVSAYLPRFYAALDRFYPS